MGHYKDRGGRLGFKSELQRAVSRGKHCEVCTLVLPYGLSESLAGNGYNPLRTALQHRCIELARHLIENYCKINREEYDFLVLSESTPLHVAARLGYQDIVKTLLKRDAAVNVRDLEGQTPLHLAVMNSPPTAGGRKDVIQCLLDRGASVNALNLANMTPLHLACQQKSLDLVTRLVARGASIHSEIPRHTSEFKLYTPLHFAVSRGSADIAGYLLERGAHVVIEGKPSPLHLAVKNNHLSMIKVLIGEQRDHFPLLLILGILNDKRDILEYLLKQGTNINPTDKESLNPLHFAAALGKPALCEFLIDKGAYIEAKQILRNDQVNEQVRLLSDYKPCLRSLKLSGVGKTALHFASENSQNAVVELLLQRGADVDSTDVNGHTALRVAGGMRNVPEMIVRKLLIYGTDFNIVDKSGQTIVDVVSKTHWSRPALMRHFVKLIQAGFDVGNRLNALIPNDLRLSDFATQCGEEIAKLRADKIVVHGIFNKTLNELAVLTKNQDVAQVLKSEEFGKKFPMYAEMLKARFVRGESRANVLGEVPMSFFESQVLCLPHLCVEKIFDNLNDGDLRRFNDACKPLFKNSVALH